MIRRVLDEKSIKALKILKAVVSAGGFSAAENLINMSTPSISRHIKSLEDDVGAQLCIRGPQGFILTDAGKIALHYAENALDALERIIPAINKRKDVLTGELRIGILDVMIENPDCNIVEAIRRLSTESPHVEIHLETYTKDQSYKVVSTGKYHIAIDDILSKCPNTDFCFLFNEVEKVYYSADTQQQVHDLPIVYRPNSNLLQRVMSEYAYKKGPSAYGLQAVASFIATGNFVGLLPVHYAERLKSRYPLEVVPGSPVMDVPFFALTNATRPLPLCGERFLDILKECHAPVA